MSVYKDVKVEIYGQVPDEYNDRTFEILMAEINLIAAKYNLNTHIHQ